jgi:acetyl esterase/lipase
MPIAAPRGPSRAKKRYWALAALSILLALALYFWPARRNYYGKLADLDVRLDIPYLPGGQNPKQALDLYLPRARRSSFPLVVFVHGGYWSALDRRWLEPLLGTHGNVGAALAHRGIGTAVIGYRQYPEVRHGDESLDDIARAIRYVHDAAPSWGADPGRLVVVGHSAGGQLVSLLGTDPRILQKSGVADTAVAGFASVDGIFDLKASLAHLKPDQAAVLRELFGPGDAALAEHSTSSHLQKSHPPLLFVDSTGDAAICRDAFAQMKARLAGDPNARFVELAGLEHNEMIVRMGMTDDPLTPVLESFVTALSAR